ncbi:MAG: phosphoenolpyruvate--protein phosphotransferase [Spirochaetaceae bacterium 4572_7]|nr:MAG: phosphoenolpyruvate--protein phosphotransferase [Spirochaetaceae bacterium 4572_7]
MTILKGISASPGISIGKVYLYFDATERDVVPSYNIESHEIENEKKRLETAVERAVGELVEIKTKSDGIVRADDGSFLDAHLLMLSDVGLHEKIHSEVENELLNVEAALLKVTNQIIQQMTNSTDTYLKERALDIQDVAGRLLSQLMYKERKSLENLTEDVILVSNNLLPSDALVMDKVHIKGIALNGGGRTSHTAILARSFEIPAVLALESVTLKSLEGEIIIIDGYAGEVIINPDDKTIDQYTIKKREFQKMESELLTINKLPAETKDGKLIYLKGNIEVKEEVDSVLSYGADGIGLFRSEFLFFQSGDIPSEDDQFKTYSQILEMMGDKSVTIRTLDVGGDKLIPKVTGDYEEKNPLLGWRAIRFGLHEKKLLKAQLRALLRSSIFGTLRIMFPMISGIEELDAVLDVLKEVKKQLKAEGIPFKEDVPVGIMIEVPSAALTSDILAKRVDFFSIGTNDLIQYTIAVDRGNEKIANMYEPFHLGVLRLVKLVIENAHKEGIPVSMCGEMAGDALASVILLGMGLDEFSMSSFSIPRIKKIIRSVSILEAQELVGTVMDMKSFKDVDKYTTAYMEEKFGIKSFK